MKLRKRIAAAFTALALMFTLTDPAALGGLIGLLLAIGIIALIYILDDTVKTPEDVENFLGLNVLTSIPISEGFKKTKKVKGMSAKKLMRNMKR